MAYEEYQSHPMKDRHELKYKLELNDKGRTEVSDVIAVNGQTGAVVRMPHLAADLGQVFFLRDIIAGAQRDELAAAQQFGELPASARQYGLGAEYVKIQKAMASMEEKLQIDSTNLMQRIENNAIDALEGRARLQFASSDVTPGETLAPNIGGRNGNGPRQI